MNCYYCGTLLEDSQTVCSRCKKENKEIVIDFGALDLVNRIPRVEPKPVEPKPVEVKPVEVKPVEVKPVEVEAEKPVEVQPQNESLPAEKETPPVEKEEAAFEKPRETEKQAKGEKQKAHASKSPKKVVVKIKPKNKH